MYFIIKYIDSIFKCYHNSDKYLCKKEVIFFLFTLVTNNGEHSIFFKVNKHWHDRKGWEKELNTMKGARLLNLRHPRIRFKSYSTPTSLVRYDLNRTLGCHRFYYLAPVQVLDPIYLSPLHVGSCICPSIIILIYYFSQRF